MDFNVRTILAILSLCTGMSCPVVCAEEVSEQVDDKPVTSELTLEKCVHIALKNHQSLKVSDENVLMAEALYQQAMSAYWPRISADVNASRADQDRTFSFQGEIDGQALTSALAKSSPALGQLMQSGLAQPISSIPLDVKTKLYNRDLVMAAVNLTYPLFTGGKINAIVGQAEKGVKIAQELRRKTRLEVVNDVKKYYFGAQFAAQMQKLTSDTLERFQVLQELTERLYQHGSMKVKKTDYLRTKTTTAMTRSMLHEAKYATDLAHEALGNAMGIEWQEGLSLVETDQTPSLDTNLEALINSAQQFNPDIQQLSLAIQASDHMIAEAKSGYYPMIGFQAEAHSIQNSYNQGLFNGDNREGWTVGIGLQWNFFDGFQTTGKVKQAEAQQRKFESQKILLDKGMALMIKQQFLRIKSAYAQIKDTENASQFASENRQLNVSAYQEELVETKDVIEAQIVETFTQGAYFRSRYALDTALANLEFLVGNKIESVTE